MVMIKIRDISDNSAAGAVGAFMIALGAGFLLSGTDMAGVASFADISVAGALNLPAAAAVLTGSLLHSVAVHSIGRNIVKIAAMVLIVITKMFYDPHSDPKTSGIISGVCVFAAGSAVSAIIGEMMYKLVFYLFYGSLTGVTVYSASYIVSGLRRRSVFDLSSGYGCAYAVVYTVLISSLCSVRNTYVNVGLICGICVTLLAAYYYRHGRSPLRGIDDVRSVPFVVVMRNERRASSGSRTSYRISQQTKEHIVCCILYRYKLRTLGACRSHIQQPLQYSELHMCSGGVHAHITVVLR